jgi:hypothetical protein
MLSTFTGDGIMQKEIIDLVDEQNCAHRQAMLKRLRCVKERTMKNPRYRDLQGDVNSVWMRDASGSDSRSVKAYLAGRGDFRAGWWMCYSTMHRLLSSHPTLEWAMYDFHRQHHVITLRSLIFWMEVRLLQQLILQQGVVKALSSFYREKCAPYDPYK